MKKFYTVKSVSELETIACALIDSCPNDSVFAFFGAMGAGKTTFIKSLCSVLGVKERVNSPTFAIVNEYTLLNESRVFHFDFYRIDKPLEAIDIGFFEYIESGRFCFIEWPEKIENLLPENCVYVHIELDDNSENRNIFWVSKR